MRQTDTHLRARKALPFIEAIRDLRPGLISPPLVERMNRIVRELRRGGRKWSELVHNLVAKSKIEYAYHTIAIEGNTLTFDQTRKVIEEGLTVEGKTVREHLEAVNIPKALDSLMSLAKVSRPLTVNDVLMIHDLVTHGIAEAEPGKFRSGFVGLTGSTYLPPPAYEVPFLIEEMVKGLNTNPNDLSPTELAFQSHLWLVSIHPFTDGNGRVARLLAALVLLKRGYLPVIVRVERRSSYIQVLQRTQRTTGPNFRGYFNFMAREYIATLAMYSGGLSAKSPEEDIVLLSEAGKKAGLDDEYLGLLARRGLIPAVKRGSRWYIREKDLTEYIIRRKRSGTPVR